MGVLEKINELFGHKNAVQEYWDKRNGEKIPTDNSDKDKKSQRRPHKSFEETFTLISGYSMLNLAEQLLDLCPPKDKSIDAKKAEKKLIYSFVKDYDLFKDLVGCKNAYTKLINGEYLGSHIRDNEEEVIKGLNKELIDITNKIYELPIDNVDWNKINEEAFEKLMKPLPRDKITVRHGVCGKVSFKSSSAKHLPHTGHEPVVVMEYSQKVRDKLPKNDKKEYVAPQIEVKQVDAATLSKIKQNTKE